MKKSPLAVFRLLSLMVCAFALSACGQAEQPTYARMLGLKGKVKQITQTTFSVKETPEGPMAEDQRNRAIICFDENGQVTRMKHSDMAADATFVIEEPGHRMIGTGYTDDGTLRQRTVVEFPSADQALFTEIFYDKDGTVQHTYRVEIALDAQYRMKEAQIKSKDGKTTGTSNLIWSEKSRIQTDTFGDKTTTTTQNHLEFDDKGNPIKTLETHGNEQPPTLVLSQIEYY